MFRDLGFLDINYVTHTNPAFLSTPDPSLLTPKTFLETTHLVQTLREQTLIEPGIKVFDLVILKSTRDFKIIKILSVRIKPRIIFQDLQG